MAELRNIRNTGVVIGGDVNRSTISVGRSGSAGTGTDEAEVLDQLDTLFTELLSAIGQLPAEQAGEAARDTVRLRAEVSAPDRDHARIHALAGNLAKAVAAAAPLVEIVTNIAELVTRLGH
jgi:hypothetical protein